MADEAKDSGLILWCGLGGLAYYPQPGQESELERFLGRCAAAGVAELVFYFGFVHAGEPTVFRLASDQRPFDPIDILSTFELYKPGSWDPWPELVQGARLRNLRVTGYTSPNYQGAVQHNPHSPLGERLPFLFLSDFANRNPQYWAQDKAGQDSLAREGYVLLDLTSAAVRDHLAQELGGIVQAKGLDGLELEWLCGAEEASPYDHGAPAASAGAVTAFLDGVRRALEPGQRLSVAVEDDLERAHRWFYDWPAWAAGGLVNRVVLRHRGRDLARIASRVRQARARLGPQVELVSQLDCWREDGLRDGKLLRGAVGTVREAGADAAGIYRADSVEAWGLWDPLQAISRD